MTQITLNQHIVCLTSGSISCDGEYDTIDPRPLAVLRILVEANGALVSHEQLHEKVWLGSIVAPNALQRCIAQLRKHFGDSAKQQSVIKTYPKRGYSLTQPVTANTENATNKRLAVTEKTNTQLVFLKRKQSSNKKKQLTFGAAAITLLVIMLSVINSRYDTIDDWQPPSFSTFASVDTGQFPLSAIQYVDETRYAARKSTPTIESLIIRDATDNQQETLVPDAKLYGRIGMGWQKNQLLWARQSVKDDIKCAQIEQTNIETKTTSTLLPCTNTFFHSPQVIDRGSFVFLATDKQFNTQLRLAQRADSAETQWQTTILAGDVKRFHYRAATNILALQFTERVKLFMLKDNLLREVATITLDETKDTLRDLKWYSDDILLLAGDKQLHWHKLSFAKTDKREHFREISSIKKETQSLALSQEISELVISPKGLNLLLARNSNAVNQRTYGTSSKNAKQDGLIRVMYAHYQDTTIAPSKFNDSYGQFVTRDHISFLSNRSGNSQLWLKSQDSIQAITPNSHNVQSYTWLQPVERPGLALDSDIEKSPPFVYIHANKLWKSSLLGASTEIETPFVPLAIYQGWHNGILLKARTSQGVALVEWHVQNLQTTIVALKDIHWAQKIGASDYLFNENAHLQRLQHQQVIPVKGLPQLTLQWRYKAVGGFVYVQDKQQRLWRYDPINQSAITLGYFDENALFMTDYSPEKTAMLSDVPQGKVTELLTLSSQYQP